jgi:small-conductance mechanosensitive channel
MDNLLTLTLDALRVATEPAYLSAIIGSVAAFVAGKVSAVVAATFLRKADSRDDLSARETWLIAVPYAVALLVLLIARIITGQLGLDPAMVSLAMRLAGWLAVIRAAAHLLRLSVGRHGRLRSWEVRATVVVWFFVAMHHLGWLSDFVAFLDAVPVTTAKNGEAGVTVWSLIRALFTVIAFVIVSAWFGRYIERHIGDFRALSPNTRIAIGKFAYAFLISIGGLLGLSASGFNLGALSIFGGALGLGLGFGLQSIAANFVSGFVLLMDKSIKPGDVISFTGSIGTSTEGFGWVQELRGRYVVVRDRDGVETLVPNQTLITNQVINWSYSDKRVRLKLPVRISYDDDPEHAMAVLLKAAACSPRILQDPSPVVRLMSFHDYGLDLELRFWIADPEAGVNNVRSDVNRAIWRLFKEAGITIPRAQLDVRMYDAAGRIIGTAALPGSQHEESAKRSAAPAMPNPFGS